MDASKVPTTFGAGAVPVIVAAAEVRLAAKTCTISDILLLHIFAAWIPEQYKATVDECIDAVQLVTSQDVESNLKKRARRCSTKSAAGSSTDAKDSATKLAMDMFG